MDEQTSQPRPVIGGTRKHMGVATSDPTYLPPVDNPNAPATDRKARVPVRKVSYGSGGSAQNYISTPKKGRAIFTSRQDRQRRRIKIALGIMIVAAIALALFWFFVLR